MVQFDDILASYRQHSRLWCPTLNKFAEGVQAAHPSATVLEGAFIGAMYAINLEIVWLGKAT